MAKPAGYAGDMWGGLAAMLVALPSAIAFGLVVFSMLGPEYAAQGALAGILGAITLGIVAPIFGGTPRLISTPSAPAAAVMAALVADLLAKRTPVTGGALQPEHIMLLLGLVAVLAGALQLLFGAIGGGRLIKYIPYPVVAGYLSGVGVLIFLGQLPRLFGLPAGTSLPAGLLAPGSWKIAGLIVGIVTITIMLLADKITRAIPTSILGLAGGLLTYAGLGAVYPELRTLAGNPLLIGQIGKPAELHLGAFLDRWAALAHLPVNELPSIVIPALTLSVLLSIDTLKTCVVIDALTRSRSNSNRELIGQGLGNLASAFAGGIPGSGQMGATLVNINSGGMSRRSSIVEGMFALVAFVFFGGLVAWVPLAALAGILLVVAFKMIDLNIFHLLRQKSTIFDFVVVAAVIVTAVAFNLIAAAGVGVGLAILLFLREQIRGTVIRRKSYGNQTFSRKQRLPEEMAVLQQQGARTAIYELQGSLFFGTADQLYTELEPDLKRRHYVILDMRRVQTVDFTAVHMLEQIEAQLAERNGVLIFTHFPPNLPRSQDFQRYFDQVGLVKPKGHVKIFEELHDALEWTEDQILAEARLLPSLQEPPLDLHEINLFKGLDAETIAALRSCVREQSFAAGQGIFTHGETGDEIFLIRRGTVRIVHPLEGGRRHHLVTFDRGDFFGDLAFLDHKTRSADAVASSPTDLYILSRARFDALAATHPQMDKKVFMRLARALALRLRKTDTELRMWEEA